MTQNNVTYSYFETVLHKHNITNNKKNYGWTKIAAKDQNSLQKWILEKLRG